MWIIVFYGLNKIARVHEVALLKFTQDNIEINSKRKEWILPISSIPKIELIDPRDLDDTPEGIFSVIIHQLDLKHIQFKLNDYGDSDKFIDNLLTYDYLKDRLVSLDREFFSAESI